MIYKGVVVIATFIVSFGLVSGWEYLEANSGSFSEQEAGFNELVREITIGANGRYTLSELESWERPVGPVRVGIQSGHWEVENAPEELQGLKRNGHGATGGGVNERDAMRTVSEFVVEILEEQGIAVDLLPVTIPSGYVADAFLSIHADGNPDRSVSGFKMAAPRRDYSGRSQNLEEYLYETYEAETGMQKDPSITWGMTGYYAFNWQRYEHAIHPMTPAVIVETGFLTNYADRQMIVSDPERVARGIATGVLQFLEGEGAMERVLGK